MQHFKNFFLKFKSNLLMKSLLVECCFCHGNPGFDFMHTSSITCYQATQIAEIFHTLQLFLISHNCTEYGYLEILITLVSSTSCPLNKPFPNQKQSISHALKHNFFLSQQHKVICIFHNANYLSSFFLKIFKSFNSFLGKVLTAQVE